MKSIKSALISVFYKENLAPIVKLLHEQNITIYSTGGTQKFIENVGIPVIAVEDLTSYPSILGGRVKTLHPKVFGGILTRRDHKGDLLQIKEYEIPEIDLVIVDLYPFEETVASGAFYQDIIEKIDIGGISLIRAAAKNYHDVLTVSSREQYVALEQILSANKCTTTLEDRKLFAVKAFDISSHYDTAIFKYLNRELPKEKQLNYLKKSIRTSKPLRYGENPHQKGVFFGNLDELFDKLHGKELSYNNLVDIDAAVALIQEFPLDEGVTFVIMKHTNACGIAMGNNCKEAYLNALKCDPISSFGGVLISNTTIDVDAAKEINKLFIEVLIAPAFDVGTLQILKSKKNRILLIQKNTVNETIQFKTLLNGIISMDKDMKMESAVELENVTRKKSSTEEIEALIFANKVVKHTKSNAIVLARKGQLLASGTGQTSRVDALKQAIHKAKNFGFDLKGSVMASDAFFPFPDCVKMAHQERIDAVIQPGGSIRDKESIKYCDENNMSMVLTGIRHFKH